MRWLRWFFVRGHAAEPDLGRCLWCREGLHLCSNCEGGWRDRAGCICRTGLLCSRHGRYWA